MSRLLQALLIPADARRRPTVVPIDPRLTGARHYVNGPVERCRYDHDAIMLVNEAGPSIGLPKNDRATEWMFKLSGAAKLGNFRQTNPDDYSLAGDVLVVGERDLGGGEFEITDVPDRFVEHFTSSLELTQGAER